MSLIRRQVSFAGRALLGQAVSIDHDWSLSASSEDILIAALGDLSDDDLEGAYRLAHHLKEAIGCLLIRRDMESHRVARNSGVASVADSAAGTRKGGDR